MTRLAGDWHKHKPYSKTIWWGLCTAGYGIAAYLGLKLEDLFGGISVIWPASGVALAFLILTERRQRNILLGIIFITGTAAYVIVEHSFLMGAICSLADALGAAIGIWALTRFCSEPITFTRSREVAVLVGIMMVAAGATTLVEAWASSTTSEIPFFFGWFSWWAADGIGVLLFTPFIITWAVNPHNLQTLSRRRTLEGITLLLLLIAVTWVGFGSQALLNDVYIFSYFVFPILIWSGLRFGPRGSTTILLFLFVLTAWLTLQVHSEAQELRRVMYMDILYREGVLVASAISTLFLATIVAELKLGQMALKEAAENLTTSEAQYRALFEQSHDAVFILDLDGNHITANRRAAEMLGYTMEEVKKISVRETSAEIEKSEIVIKRLLAGEHIPTYERLFRRKNGEIVPVEINVELVRDPAGNPLHIQSVVRDISKRKQTEQRLRENEALLMNSQKIAKLGFYVLDIETGCWQSSEVLDDIFGIDPGYPADVNGWLAIVHPEQRNELYAYFIRHVLSDHQPFDLEYRIVRVRDQQERWVHGLGELEYDENGTPIRMIGTIQDITERKQREREMESFLQISQSLSGTLELKPLLEEILGSAIRAIPNAEKGTVLLLNDEGNLEIKTSIGYSDPRLLTSSFPPTSGYSAKAFREMGPVLLGDVRVDENICYNGDIEEMLAVKSAIAVPLIVQDHPIGVIAIDNAARHNAFNTDNIQLLTTLASSAALAIENARLFDETRQHLAELEAVQAVSTSLRMARNMEEALPIILDETLRALKTEAGMIMLYDPVKHELQNAVRRGWFEDMPQDPAKPGEGIAGSVFASGESHFSMEFARDPLVQPSARNLIIPGWGGACVPIRTTTETIGVIFVSVALPRQISLIQMKMLEALAEMTGAALQRMRLHEETSRRAEEFAALYRTSTTISGDQELNTLLQTIVDQATSLLKASSGGIYLNNPARNDLTLMVSSGPSVPVGTHLQPGEGMAGHVAQTGKPMRVDDYSVWRNHSPKFEHIPIRATMEVPMMSGGELIGVLAVHEMGQSQRTFTDADERLLSLFAAQAAGAIRSARLYEESLERVKHLQTLRSIDRAITANMDSNVTLKILLNQVVSQMNISAASILLFNPNTLTLEFKLGEGFRVRDKERTSIRLGEDYAGMAALERRMISVSDPSDINEGPLKEFLAKESLSSCHLAPMIAKGQILGVLQVFSRKRVNAGHEWLEFIEALATQAAIAVDNARLFQNLQQANFELTVAYDATIERWSQALELRYKEDEGHRKQAIELTIQIARAAGIEEKMISHVRRGAILHDIGNMAIPDSILQKPASLTGEEWNMVRRHPSFAYEMLTHVSFLKPALDIPYCHHERWDGSGYPRGLLGEQIPLSARIFSVADVWDALTSNRPYRKAWPHKQAMNYIRSQSGKLFDPKIVDLFLQFADKMEKEKSQN